MYQISFTSLAFAAHALAACDRATLQDAATAYLTAQRAGSPIPSLASNASYAENDKPVDITKGVLSQPITIDFNRSFYDTTQCAAFTEITAATNSHPYVIHTHITLSPADSKITAIESVVTDAGDWAFNAAGHLKWTQQEKWDTIPEAQRDTRTVIQAAADAYLDEWADTSIAVPLNTPCARLEGGAYTGQSNPNGNTCGMPAFPQPLEVGNRRYVIDEEMGAVSVFNGFPWLEASLDGGSTPSSNEIRVEGGKIRYIHEVTMCQTTNCGR
ncbi:hypothetical protein F5Y18DRAFT_438168 [Xylariaceae sp. FL1019]|nr:hypothetical protein F5Y18DRAFT_438168 [Xylariaceae sp. FL1019]